MTSDRLPHQVKHEILFDEVLMPWLLEWLMICSQVHACAQHGPQHLCACLPPLSAHDLLAVQPSRRAPHRRRVRDGGLRAARAHREGAAECTPECRAPEQRQAAQGCYGPGACRIRLTPVHAGACKVLTTAHAHVCASEVLTTAPTLRPTGALGQCGAARCARGGRVQHALDHLRPGECTSEGWPPIAMDCL